MFDRSFGLRILNVGVVRPAASVRLFLIHAYDPVVMLSGRSGE